jgi:hypothetical protein
MLFKMRCDGIEERLYDERRVELGIVPAKGDRHSLVRHIPERTAEARDGASMPEDLVAGDFEFGNAQPITEAAAATQTQFLAEVGHRAEEASKSRGRRRGHRRRPLPPPVFRPVHLRSRRRLPMRCWGSWSCRPKAGQHRRRCRCRTPNARPAQGRPLHLVGRRFPPRRARAPRAAVLRPRSTRSPAQWRAREGCSSYSNSSSLFRAETGAGRHRRGFAVLSSAHAGWPAVPRRRQGLRSHRRRRSCG